MLQRTCAEKLANRVNFVDFVRRLRLKETCVEVVVRRCGVCWVGHVLRQYESIRSLREKEVHRGEHRKI